MSQIPLPQRPHSVAPAPAPRNVGDDRLCGDFFGLTLLSTNYETRLRVNERRRQALVVVVAVLAFGGILNRATSGIIFVD